jgi:hypothetical protein
MKTKNRIPRVYIAGKFRGKTNAEIQRNIDTAAAFQAPIAQAGAFPVCVHAMEGLRMHDLQQDNHGAFWLEATMDELHTCDAVVLVPGWQESVGSYNEAAEALRLGMPVFEAVYIDGGGGMFNASIPEGIEYWDIVYVLAGVPGAACADYSASYGYTFATWIAEVTR